MKTHLKIKHRIDENKAREHQMWIENSIYVTLNQNGTISCRRCYQVFPENYVCLMKHLITHKEVDVPLEFKQTG